MNLGVTSLLAAATLIASPAVWPQDNATGTGYEVGPQVERPAPLNKGLYVAPMASYVLPYDNRGLDDGIGATLGIGYRYGVLAVEAEGEYAKLDAKGEGDSAKLTAVHVGLLWFPFTSLKGLYGVGAIGRLNTKTQPVGNLKFEADSLEAGTGYLFPISFGKYEFAVRTEARVRFSERGRPINLGDDNLPRRYQDVLLNFGLQLPLGVKKDPPPPPAPVEVVAPPPSVCADGIDNDGDGQIDFPADPGCSAADDMDETDPCKAPLAGERISLKGCATGDVLVLRGVNFDFDKASLTPDARTILDNVAEELLIYADIKVEIGGHTDAKGSDEYNQKLSDERAASVVGYLASKGVAADRMTPVGYGETLPVADNESDEGRELNRRVELKVMGGGQAQVIPAPAAVVAQPAAAGPLSDAPSGAAP